MTMFIGIDAGSVSVNAVVTDAQGAVCHETPYQRHFGRVGETAAQVLDALYQRFDPGAIQAVGFTGTLGQPLSALTGAPYTVETIAQVQGVLHVAPGVRAIIAIGGQDAAFFEIDYDAQGQWRLSRFQTNGPCASGTGSFLDQQAERLSLAMYGEPIDLDPAHVDQVLADFIALGEQATSPAPVACRCTVFTKSDMIHLQNKGEPLANIIAGLHQGTAANFTSTLIGNREPASPLVFIGGLASNRLQVAAFQNRFPNLRVPPHHTSLGALGAALEARRNDRCIRPEPAQLRDSAAGSGGAVPRTEPLRLRLSTFAGDNTLPPLTGVDVRDAWLGIDIGSTSTKYALIDADGHLIHKAYRPTRGKPIEVAQALLRHLHEDAGERIRLRGVATTGSGRNVVGDFLKADLVIDEITAHARGALAVDPHIDTLFEIGGQDAKFIAIEDGHPRDFAMNKVCAAGTGSFLHELANKLNINIQDEFQQIALSAPAPVNPAERCTVFMESDLSAYAQQGVARNDLIAGLCYAIVRNYLHRVVENRRIGQRIMFLGGPSLNKGIVAAFERVLNRPILAPPHREVMGAFGAALALRAQTRKAGDAPPPRALKALGDMQVSFTERLCQADRHCHNACKLKVYAFGERKSIWGGDCGRFEGESRASAPPESDFFRLRREAFTQALAPACAPEPDRRSPPDEARPSIGVPQGLHTLEWGVLWAHLLHELGFRVVFSPPTRQDIATAGVETMTAETCFPIKVFQGHVRYLLDRTDYLFLPTVIDTLTQTDEEKGQYCPLVQSAPFLTRAGLGLDPARMVAPVLRLKDGPVALAEPLRRALPRRLRPAATRVAQAAAQAWARQADFAASMRRMGEAALATASPDQPVWVISGRPYNLHDERLNLQLGRRLAGMGIKALPVDLLELDAEPLSDFPRMYWGLGARILRAAARIARLPNVYGVHLTNFSCGPDSFLEHFYAHVLARKPFLILELDEHSAVAGVQTRLEAFRNVVANHRERAT